jgi:cell division protein FtsI (penicillin-binding protein 3)
MLAYRTIGVFRDNNVTGLEAKYNKSCVARMAQAGAEEYRQYLDTHRWVVKSIRMNGKDIVTTLDIDVQDVAEHALMSILQKYECMYGTCIVMETQTGKIRTLVNLGRQP